MKTELAAVYKFFSEPRRMYVSSLVDTDYLPYPVRDGYVTIQLVVPGDLKSYQTRGRETTFFWSPARQEDPDEEFCLAGLDVWHTCLISRCNGLPRAFMEIPETGYAVRLITVCPFDLQSLP